MTNTQRQPTSGISTAVSEAAITAPAVMHVAMAELATPRSECGNQCVNVLADTGTSPAWAIPDITRDAQKPANPCASPVQTAEADHQILSRGSTKREPHRLPSEPPGIWNQK